jgi:hypothetical protein
MGFLDEAIREHLDLKRRRGADPDEIERMEQDALGPVRRSFEAEEFEEYAHVGSLDETDEAEPYFEAPNEEDDGYGTAAARDESRTELLTPPPAETLLTPEEERPAPPTGSTEHSYEHETALEPELPSAHEKGFAHEHGHGHGNTLGYEHLPAGEPEVARAHEVAFDPDAASDAPPLAAEEPGYGDERTELLEPAEPSTGELPLTGERVPADPEYAEAEPRLAAPRRESSAEPPEPKGDDVLEETPEFLQDAPEHDQLWFEQRPPRDFDFGG